MVLLMNTTTAYEIPGYQPDATKRKRLANLSNTGIQERLGRVGGERGWDRRDLDWEWNRRLKEAEARRSGQAI